MAKMIKKTEKEGNFSIGRAELPLGGQIVVDISYAHKRIKEK
jgi:hypothetical protein